MRSYFLVLFVVAAVIEASFSAGRPQVKTPLGEVRGTIRDSNKGRKYSAFEGIPFAKPTFGDRRFEEPEPIEPWIGVWDANFLTECAQNYDLLALAGNVTKTNNAGEDCLHINVYVPREQPDPSERLDVIVDIHGGAYMVGSGHFYSSPNFLMNHDVIFVTFNYRVGILGFLSTEDDVVPGNNGLKDQVLALKWVQNNIASFGGNPDSVTLTGVSAGASSVQLHYFSNMSRGLFHKGFSISGVALNSWSLAEKALNKAKILAEALGCPTNNSKELVQCLKQRPFKQLLDKVPLFHGYSALPIAPFAPVVEKGSKPFLAENPYSLLVQGKINDVPWIASNAAQDGTIPVFFFMNDLSNINKNWDSLAPILLDCNYTLPKSSWKSVAKKVKDHYLGEDQEISKENLSKLIELFTDRIFVVDAETSVREQAKVSKSPIYYYRFAYEGDNNPFKVVGHGADIKYYYGDKFMGTELTDSEKKMSDLLLEMLVSYAKTSIPTIKGVDWKPTGHEKLTYLDIKGVETGEINLETVEEYSPRAFWTLLGLQENENLMQKQNEL